MPLSRFKEAGYKDQIGVLAAILERRSQTTNKAVSDKVAWAADKLALAHEALAEGNEEGTWLHLYDAAKFCVTQGLDPSAASAVATEVDRLLEQG